MNFLKDGITFTPFNMKEELEEGHFDSEGMYIFKKEQIHRWTEHTNSKYANEIYNSVKKWVTYRHELFLSITIGK